MNEVEKQSFFEEVFSVVKQIPYGMVTSYGAIAKHIGSPQAARMVGWALNKSISSGEFIPAHRVVNRNGMLTGKAHFGGNNIMKELLENEGITIVDNSIIDFEKHFWNPNELTTKA